METTSCYQITEAKLELMQKIINAHLTEEELKELTDYAKDLKNNKVGRGTPKPILTKNTRV